MLIARSPEYTHRPNQSQYLRLMQKRRGSLHCSHVKLRHEQTRPEVEKLYSTIALLLFPGNVCLRTTCQRVNDKNIVLGNSSQSRLNIEHRCIKVGEYCPRALYADLRNKHGTDCGATYVRLARSGYERPNKLFWFHSRRRIHRSISR